MDIESYRAFCLQLPLATESTPFGPDVLIFKVHGKMFASLSLDGEQARSNLKCAPEWALELREEHEGVQPGYHMNKKHWNTLILDGSIPPGEIERQIDNSYSLIVKGLKKSDRAYLERLYPPEQLHPDDSF